MSTAPAPTGALSRRGTHEPTRPQTQPFDTMRRLAGRLRIGLSALASGQISYAGCVSADGFCGLCAATDAPPLTGAMSVAVSPDAHVLARSASAPRWDLT